MSLEWNLKNNIKEKIKEFLSIKINNDRVVWTNE